MGGGTGDPDVMRSLASLLLLVMALVAVACEQSTSQAADGATTSLLIEGMHCDACAESIHEIVIVIPGIEACRVSFADGDATIIADSPATVETAIERIRILGFTVEPINPS